MVKEYRVYQVDAFTQTKFTGNPAGVVINADGLTTVQMQQIARELNNSETAFVFHDRRTDYDLRVRFFTPTVEVPTCGHATIATHYVNAQEQGLQGVTQLLQKTQVGILPVTTIQTADDYRVVMTQGSIEVGPVLSADFQNEILAALGLKVSDLRSDCPLQIVSTGNGKVLIGLNDLVQLNNLQPDLTKLAAISQQIKCNGYYAFVLTPGQENLVHGRMFAPASGIVEDPVTGNQRTIRRIFGYASFSGSTR